MQLELLAQLALRAIIAADFLVFGIEVPIPGWSHLMKAAWAVRSLLS
jgi:hypothetical protein